MCGIIACRTNQPAIDYLSIALRRLEYRGYDSAGGALQTTGGQVARLRTVGRIGALEKLVRAAWSQRAQMAAPSHRRDFAASVFIARGTGLRYAAEGALKLKELTYRWAEHYPAGELKHGPLALIANGTPVVVIDNGDSKLTPTPI